MEGAKQRPGRTQENRWWLCTMSHIIKTGSCWIGLIFCLVASVVVSRSILIEYPFKEEDYVFHYPFNSIFDAEQRHYHTVECENCEVFGSHEDLDDYVETKHVTTTFFFENENNDLDLLNKTFNDSDYSCLKFEVRRGEDYFLNLVATADITNFVLHYEGANKSHHHVVEAGKPFSLNFSGDENDHILVCLRTEDDINPVSSDFSTEIIVMDGRIQLHNCTPICQGYENYFIQPNHGISMVYYSEYLPTYTIILIGFVPFVVIFLVSIMFCFRLTVGCAAYPCLKNANSSTGRYQDLRVLVTNDDDFNPNEVRL